MDSEPLSYQGLKSVLHHMEANLRFKIAQNIPTIRYTEKSVPLKINYLCFGEHRLIVNKTEYKLGIYQKRLLDNESDRTHPKIREKYFYYDLDRYGVADHSAGNELLPGDISTGRERWIEVGRRGNEDEERMQLLETMLQEMEEKRARGDSIHLSYIVNSVTMKYRKVKDNNNLEPAFIEETKNALEAIEHRSRENANKHVVQLEDMEEDQHSNNFKFNVKHDHESLTYFKKTTDPIERVREKLLPYHCKRDNIPFPHENFLQLTITTSDGHQQAQRTRYHMKLHKAMKYLNTNLFGERRHNLHVKKFKLDGNNSVLRVPFGLKLNIRELILIGDIKNSFEGLRPLVEDSSYPLKVLNIRRYVGNTDCAHPVVRTAQKLILSDLKVNDAWFRTMLNLPNRIVFLKNAELSVENYVQLFQNWIETGRKIETCYSFAIKEEETALRILQQTKERFNGIIFGQRCFTIAMGNSSRLDVSCRAKKSFNQFEKPWILKIEVKENQWQA